jgi:hypothetical protein
MVPILRQIHPVHTIPSYLSKIHWQGSFIVLYVGVVFPPLTLGVGVRLSPLGMSATIWSLYQPWMIDECRAVSGIRIGRGNRSTPRKPAIVPLCPPQIPHYLTWTHTQATAEGRRWLTAWAMAPPGVVSLS